MIAQVFSSIGDYAQLKIVINNKVYNSIEVKMYQINTEIGINASAEKVWEILSETKKFAEWNPFVKNIDGELKEGQKISVLIQPVNGKPMMFHPKLLSVIPGKEVRWLGSLLFKGLFDGEHIWEIKSTGEKSCRFIHRENFNGLLVPLFKKELETKTKPGFDLMNEKLKELAEAA